MNEPYTPNEKIGINLTQLFGAIWFGKIKGEDIAPDEATSAFVWRKQYVRWICFVNWLFGDLNHCRNAYESEQQGRQQAPEYRVKG